MPHALALQEQEELPRVALGRAGPGARSGRRRPCPPIGLTGSTGVSTSMSPTCEPSGHSVRVVVPLLANPVLDTPNCFVRALLQTNAATGREAHAGRQVRVGVLQLGLPDRVVGVIAGSRARSSACPKRRAMRRPDRRSPRDRTAAAATGDRQVCLQEVLEGLVLPAGVRRHDATVPDGVSPALDAVSCSTFTPRSAPANLTR